MMINLVDHDLLALDDGLTLVITGHPATRRSLVHVFIDELNGLSLSLPFQDQFIIRLIVFLIVPE